VRCARFDENGSLAPSALFPEFTVVPIGREAAIPNPALTPFSAMIGEWKTAGSHPLLPGVRLHGRAAFEWLEGGAFLILRTEMDEPEVPSGIAIFGSDDAAGEHYMLYFDERGVSRRYEVELLERGYRWFRNAPGFSQRFVLTLSEDGKTMVAAGELSKDGVTWEGDLELRYTRADA
jgi:hypothetical protein